MPLRDFLKCCRAFVFGTDQQQVALGGLATVALFVVGAYLDGLSQVVGITGINAAALAGLLTGLSLGRCGWRAPPSGSAPS